MTNLPTSPAPVPPPAHAARAHVLIVIEHIWLRSVIADLLTICVRGVVVHEAGSRSEALALARDVPVKAIVIDADRAGGAVPRLIDELGAAAPNAHLLVLDDVAALPEYDARPSCVAISKDDAAKRLPALVAEAISADVRPA